MLIIPTNRIAFHMEQASEVDIGAGNGAAEGTAKAEINA